MSTGSNPGYLTTTPLWHWNTASGTPTILGFSLSQFESTGVDRLTKTGLVASDVQSFINIPLVANGLTPTPLTDVQLTQFIRYAEDDIEQYCGVLLCPTWIASPPEITSESCQAAGIAGTGQRLGVDYDLVDSAYDFDYERFRDEGWGYLSLRYRPLRNLTVSETDYTAMKNMVYIYPLLSQFFAIPRSWFVEEQDFGLERIVPAENVQMLPLFAMQLALMGFAQSLAGAMHIQYTAGFTDNDYSGRFSFIKRLVLIKASIIALSSIQGTINLGALERSTTVDGLTQKITYKDAAFVGIIKELKAQEEKLTSNLINNVSGPFVDSF